MKRYFSQLIVPITIQIIFTILYSITVALLPVLNKYLFDNVLNEGMSLVIKLILLYFTLIIFNSIFQYISRVYEWNVSKEFHIKIKSDLFIHIASLKNSAFKEKASSDYLAIFKNNVDAIDEDYISAYIDLFKSIINIVIFASALLIFVDWRIAVLVFGLSILTAYVPKIMQERLSKYRKQQLSSLSSYFGKVLDLLSGKKRINRYSIKSFTNEHTESLINSEEKRLSFGKIKTVSDLLNAMGVFFIEICTFGVVAYLMVEKEITIGTGIASFGYVTSFLSPIKNILQCINCINSTKETVEETIAYLDSKPLEAAERLSENIDVNSLLLHDISYNVENFSLESFTYNFDKGKKYAIIGHSGSGKSTLMRLIDGSVEPSSGKILINGDDLEQMDREDYIFSVDQFEYLFQTSYLNNVTIFDSMNDDKKLASRLLDRLSPTTRDKITNYERVEQLSGGEKQILSILRMLIANRPIVLLDESFSSVDKKNAQLIKDYILSLKDKIIIEVTHNTTKENLKNYDSIISFEEGKMQTVIQEMYSY